MVAFIFFNIIIGNSNVSTVFQFLVNTESTLNGSSSEFGFQGDSFIFYLDPTAGAIVLFGTIIGILALGGITVVGTGLSTGNAVAWVGVYAGLWGLLSVFGSIFIRSIDTFGWLIYLGITLMYVIGVVIHLSGGES